MKKFFPFLFLALAVMSLSSCDIDDGANFHFVPLQVVSAEFPESFDINETYEIKVTFVRPNGCTFFEGFDISKPDKTERKVVAIGARLTDDEACTEVIEEVETSFQFIVLYSETYLFRFWTGEDENGEQQYLEIEVPVNEISTD